MPPVTILCPHCGFQREVPAEKIPPGTVRVTCPRCRQAFALDRDAASPAAGPPVDTAGSHARPDRTAADPGTPSPAAATQETDGAAPPPRPTPPPAPTRRPAPRPAALMPVGDLFDRTWELYKHRFGTLILIYLAIVALVVGPLAVLAGVGLLTGFSAVTIGALVVVGLLAIPLLATWGGAAFTCATVDDRIGVGEAFRRGRTLILPFLWVFTLLAFLITGGYLLLIIPGILFSVWFFFAQFIVAAEETRGMAALIKSREYVRGHGWGVFGRMLLVMVMGGILGAIPLVGPLLSVAFTPYFMLWMFLIYQELRVIKGEPAFACGAGEKARWLVRGAAGYAVVPLLLLALFGPMLYHQWRNLTSGDWSAIILPELALPGRDPQPPPRMETMRPADFPLLNGSWSGPELNGGEPWQFSFQQDTHGVTVVEPDGNWFSGSAVIRFDLGERDGSIRVPPGWSVLDVDITSATRAGQAGEAALGTFTVQGDDLKLCLGQPGSTRRAEEFASSPEIRCFQLARASGMAGAPAYQHPSDSGRSAVAPTSPAPAPTEDGKPDDVSVFVYVANYTGGIRVNGREFKAFEGEKDMQYNYNNFGDDYFTFGENTIEVDYAPLEGLPADYWLLKIHLKVSRGNTVIGDWEITERDAGTATFTLDIPQ